MISEAVLAKTLFPLSNLLKTEVRQLALEHQLPNAQKKDSTGICFIGERKFKSFLQEFLLAQPGVIKNSHGKEVGRHEGLIYYTLGQRKGLNIGGIKEAEESAWYVVDKELSTNTLIVEQGHDHPLLYKSSLLCEQLHWINAEPIHTQIYAKIRYRQKDQACELIKLAPDRYQVNFKAAQRAITPGQSVVFYEGDVCLGGGIVI